MTDQIRQQEERYLSEVTGFAARKQEGIVQQREGLKQEILEQAGVMREELGQMIIDFDDIIQLSLENEALTRVQKRYEENEKEFERLEKIRQSPYFARIDFTDPELGEENTVYIGARGLSDPKNCQMYVCDWRAPVCELFYGYDTGEACFETAGGSVEVRLNQKRQFQIRDGLLEGVYDSEASVYDEILGEVLSARTEAGLKVIVESIQKEQNRAIRFGGKRSVLIQGPAGSGKTSVGMHRLAYLLYAQKDSLRAEDVVILSNNRIFAEYVSGILPQLEEEEVVHTVFSQLLEQLLPEELLCEDFYEQARAVEVDEMRRKSVAWKYSRELPEQVEQYFDECCFEIPDLYYEEELIVTGEELNDRMRRRLEDRRGKGSRESYSQRLEWLITIAKKAFENFFLEHQERICERIAEQEPDENGDRPEGKALQWKFKMRRRAAVTEAVETIRARNGIDTFGHLYRILDRFALTGGKGSDDEVLQNAAEIPQKAADALQNAAEVLQRDWNAGKLRFEDALLYVIVGLHTGEIKPDTRVRHVLIDELQDYGPLQLYLIRKLYPESVFTLLADNSQAVDPVLSLQDPARLEEIWNMSEGAPLEKLILSKSYRSSAPINAFAFRYLEQFDPGCAKAYTYFRRNGKEPQELRTGQPVEAVAALLEQLPTDYRVGILTTDETEARTLGESIRAQKLQILENHGGSIREKRMILPLMLSKGLEFDAVILYRFRNRLRGSDSYARKMYLGCTRALHELYLVDTP